MVLKSNQLTWHNRVGVTELSNMGVRPGEKVPTRLGIFSTRTGKTVTFKPVKCVLDEEGEPQYWLYRSILQPDVEVHVFND